MANRFAGLKDIGGKAPSPAPAAASKVQDLAEAPATRAPASTQAPSRAGKVVISAYFDPAVRQQFAILAIKENRSQAALLADALNLLFEKHGEAPIARA